MPATASDGLHHLGTELAREHGEQVAGVDPSSRRGGLGFEGLAERVEPELVAFEASPGVVEMVGGVHRADEPGGQPVVTFVALEGVEGAVGDDAPEVEEHGCDGRSLGRLRRAHRSDCRTSPSQSSADSPSEATSTRSSTPWNIAAYCSNDNCSLKSPKP